MIFVTGGTGMVGAHLLYDLVCRGEKVRALKRPQSKLSLTEKIFAFYSTDYQSLLQRIEWVEGDLLEKEQLREHLKDVELIYHAAAMISFDPRDRETMIHNNTEGTANLVDLAVSLQITRFCHVSSIAAIGTPPDGIDANENHPWRNHREHSSYALSKYLSEMEVWRGSFQGLNVVVVNPSVILGPGDWKSGSAQLFHTVWRGLKFFTRGGTGFVDVRDVTDAMQQLMADDVWESTKNQRYILNAENVSFRKIFDQIATALEVRPPKFFAGDLLLVLACKLSVIKKILTGIQPSITRETARSANKLSYYDGSKTSETIGFKYRPIAVSVQDISTLFLKDFVEKRS